MRGLRAVASAAALCCALWCGSARAAQPLELIVDGTPVLLRAAPVEYGGAVFVPLRGVFERLGSSVAAENGVVTVSSAAHALSLRVGSRTATIDGRAQTIEAAPVVIGGSVYVPLQLVSQALGVRVRYDAASRVVAIGVRHLAVGPNRGAARPPRPAVASEVIDSVYDTVTRDRHAERPGYGRYTYLLLMTPSEADRNAALLAAVMGTTPAAGSVTTAPARLNVFEIPEKPGYDRSSARANDPAYALANYDFGLAHDLVARACSAPTTPTVCTGTLTGPFLLTYGKPLESVAVANPPYLIVDLQPLNVNGFSHIVAMMKQQVKETDVADGHLVQNWSIRLLSTTLDVSDWLPNIVSGVRRIEGSLVGGAKPP